MEIGSEFELFNVGDRTYEYRFNLGNDEIFLYSGRTCIDFIIKDILLHKKIKTVYFPNYFCSSMIEPFLKNGIRVKYYSTNFVNNKFEIDININESFDVFFFMNYFGYSESNIDESILKKLKTKGVIIIEDCTHRLFCKHNHSCYSDYCFASLRKWIPIYCGAICSKKIGVFTLKKLDYPDEQLISLKKQAMLQKYEYLHYKKNEKLKLSYLSLFKEFNNRFGSMYENLLIDKDSLYIVNHYDYEKMINQRKKNAEYLSNELGDRLLFSLSDNDCPIFVPIHSNYRDKLREKLIEKQIYCPVHWPKPFENLYTNMFDIEISLICDQRYSKHHMRKIVQTVNENNMY